MLEPSRELSHGRQRRYAIAVIVLAQALSSMAFAAQDGNVPIRFGNEDTKIIVTAGSTAPRIVELRHGRIAPWVGATDAELIATATVDHAERTLAWRFDAAGTYLTRYKLVLVYETPEPHLRLSWVWQVGAQKGPLEHTISIENLSGHEVWLPRQPSLRFAWK